VFPGRVRVVGVRKGEKAMVMQRERMRLMETVAIDEQK
jgi:hypothetical protein